MLFKPLNHIATKQRLPLLAPKGNIHSLSTPPFLFFHTQKNTPRLTIYPPNAPRALAPPGHTLYAFTACPKLYSFLHKHLLQPFCRQMRLARICPCQKQGIHPPRNRPLHLCFFKPLNHIAIKHRLRCLPRQDFSAFSIRLPPHPFCRQTHRVRLPLQKQGNFPISNRRTLPPLPAPPFMQVALPLLPVRRALL